MVKQQSHLGPSPLILDQHWSLRQCQYQHWGRQRQLWHQRRNQCHQHSQQRLQHHNQWHHLPQMTMRKRKVRYHLKKKRQERLKIILQLVWSWQEVDNRLDHQADPRQLLVLLGILDKLARGQLLIDGMYWNHQTLTYFNFDCRKFWLIL